MPPKPMPEPTPTPEQRLLLEYSLDTGISPEFSRWTAMSRWFRHQFHIANSAAYLYKDDYFYPLKHRLLQEYGFYDGWDLQTITHFCWRCEGSGIDPYLGDDDESCERCGGDGIWSQRKHYLLRWILGDRLYHVPTNAVQSGLPKKSFLGKLHHDSRWSASEGERAMMWLLLRYEPQTWLRLQTHLLRMQFRNWLFRLNLQLRKRLTRQDPPPF